MTTLETVWQYQANVTRVVDGDTLDVLIDLGFRTSRVTRLRLAVVDTAEIFGIDHDTKEYALGIEQKQWVADWVDEGQSASDTEWPFIVVTGKATGKYGRWIGEVVYRRSDDTELQPALIDEYPEVADR